MSGQLNLYRGGIPKGLSLAVPRPVRLARKIRYGLLIAVIIGAGWAALCIFGTIYLALVAAKPWQHLRDHGRVVEGRATHAGMIKGFGRTSRNYINYEFTTAEGQVISGRLQLGVAQKVDENQTFTYLPENPSQHVIGAVDDDRLAAEERTRFDWIPTAFFLAGFPNLIGGLIVLAFVVGDLRQVQFAKFADVIIGRIDQLDARGFHYIANETDPNPITGRVDTIEWNGRPVQTGDPVPLLKAGRRVEYFPALTSIEWRDPGLAVSEFENT